MCGRYSMPVSLVELARMLEAQLLKPSVPLVPSYKIAPGQNAPVLLMEKGQRQLQTMRWGLARAQGATDAINIRSETLLGKAFSVRNPAARPCVAPAFGFYEWDRNGQPHYFHFKSYALLLLGALCWPQSGGSLGFGIITTPMTSGLAHIHERAPLLIGRRFLNEWLSGESLGDCVSGQGAELACHPVSRSVKGDTMACIAPSADPLQAELF